MKAACAFTASLAVFLLVSTAAMAAPSEGELLFREGRAAMQDKNYERACLKFAESQKKEPAPGTALNLGECEEQRGRLIAAAEAFTLAASTFTSPEKQRYASSRAEAVERRTPRVTVKAQNPAPGLVVHVGNDVIPIDTEVKMDPGEIVVRAEAPGRKPNTVKATLREGKNVEIDVGTLEAAESSGGPGGSDTTDPDRPRPKGDETDLRQIGLIAAGAGALSLVVGTVTGIMTLDRASTVKEKCPNGDCEDQVGVDAARSGSTLSLVSTITFIAGGVLVAGGGALYFFSPRPAKATGAVRLAPMAAPGTGGLLLGGSF